MDLKIKGKVAVVTGAAKGIGRAIALRLAAEGATVVVSDLIAEDARNVVDEIVVQGGKGKATQADATMEDQVNRMIRETMET